MNKAHQKLTDTILDLLAQGVVPWKQPFSGMQAPRSAQSGKAYRGANSFLLHCESRSKGYQNPYWLTYKQAQERGGNVRRGEKGSPIFFWSPLYLKNGKAVKDPSIADERKFCFKSFTVFNREQVDGLPDDALQGESFQPRTNAEQIDAAEEIIAGYKDGPAIQRSPGSAYYSPAIDVVSLPVAEEFVSDELHYSVLFHELAHSTGHANRLGRFQNQQGPASFGSREYGKEELVAEMAAAFLCAEAGIDSATIDNSAAYIDGWRKAISSDVQIVAKASAAASKAAEWILGREA